MAMLGTVLFDTMIVCVTAVLYSCMEIETEGAYGWAKHLPTTKNIFQSFSLYHLYMLAFLIAMFLGWFLSRFLSGWVSGWSSVFQFGFYLILWLLIEDFVWFVLNPHFTLKRYTKKDIGWHTTWVGPTPVHNITGILALVVLCLLEGSNMLWVGLLVASSVVLLIVALAPMYHRWYIETHKPHML